MFVEVDGPTALRPEMVRALAFSVGEKQVETSNGIERCVAAVASVWNGQEGFVAVLLRSLDRPGVRRFTLPDPIRSIEQVDLRREEAMGFAADLGFVMDNGDFMTLDSAAQGARLRRWNELRKPRGASRSERATPDSRAAPQPQSEAENGESGRAVLGRIALVRHEGEEKPDRLARLLVFF